MADFRIPPRPPPGSLPAPAGPQRTEPSRTAQAAFFQAARGQPVPTPTPAPKPAPATAPSSDRPLRPGSLLDIKV